MITSFHKQKRYERMEKQQMEKLKNVGAGPVSAQKEVIDNCPEFLKRNKSKKHWIRSVHSNFNGITLIALIITIIVMLILVGVTISVALNGGLFNTAQSAATNTIIESEKEQLLSAVVASMEDDAKVNFTKLDSNLPTSEWSGTGGTYISPKKNKYKVNSDGTIENMEQGKNYSFTVGELLDKVNDETITLDDLKELCKDEELEINRYLTKLDGLTLCYTSSDNATLCSIESWLDRMKNNKLNRCKCNDTYYRRRGTVVSMSVWHI